MKVGRLARVFFFAILVLAGGTPRTTYAQGDEFVRGYAAAILQRDFNITADAVSVTGGVVTVRADLSDAEGERLKTALGQISGVERVVLEPSQAQPSRWSWLPRREIFRPLIADPRWPRFSASYQQYIDERLENVASANIGETFALLQYDLGRYGAVQGGIQGGVFAIFDLGSDSFDLVNADYFAAIPIEYRTGNFSAVFRAFHQSSHLGDEFLLKGGVKRINLSYEALDLLLSYDFGTPFRIYGGGGVIVDRDPGDLGRGLLQIGAEYIGDPWGWWIQTRPVAAVDLQLQERSDWTPSVAPMAGLQFGTGSGEQRSLRLLLEYFNGKSPNGQFYRDHIQYFALNGQLNF